MCYTANTWQDNKLNVEVKLQLLSTRPVALMKASTSWWKYCKCSIHFKGGNLSAPFNSIMISGAAMWIKYYYRCIFFFRIISFLPSLCDYLAFLKQSIYNDADPVYSRELFCLWAQSTVLFQNESAPTVSYQRYSNITTLQPHFKAAQLPLWPFNWNQDKKLNQYPKPDWQT